VAQQPAFDALAIAAYGNGGKLLIARQAGDGCTSRVYRAMLGTGGRVGRLTRLGPVIRGIVASVATDANAALIGYFVGPCGKSASGGYLAVLNVRTGRVRRWTGVALYGSGGSIETGTALSMSASGRLVVFTGQATGTGGRIIGQRVWEMRTSAPAGPLRAHVRVVLSRPESGPALSAAVLSPGGKSFYLCTVTTNGTASAHATVTQTAVITDRRSANGSSAGTVAKLTATGVTSAGEDIGCPMAGDPGGGYLLVPYALRFASSTETGPRVRAARISVARRSVAVLSFRLPGSAGMSVATGLSIAW